MRADRSKRAAILTAEGVKQSAILTAEGEKQSAILTAQGARESEILRAEGQAKAIATVFKAIHDGNPDPALLAYQYLEALPKVASYGIDRHRRPERADDRDAEDHRRLQGQAE